MNRIKLFNDWGEKAISEGWHCSDVCANKGRIIRFSFCEFIRLNAGK